MIRPLKAKDLPSVLSVASSAFEEEARRPEVIGPGFLDSLSRRPDLQIGAFEGEELIGFLIGDEGEDWGLVNWIAVSPDQQKKGVGTALINEFEERVRARGKRRVRLGTPFARGFYERLGYKCVGTQYVLWKKLVGGTVKADPAFDIDLEGIVDLLEDYEMDSVRCAFNPGCLMVGREGVGVALAMENRWSKEQVDVLFSKYGSTGSHFLLLDQVEARARARGAYSVTERFEEGEVPIARQRGWSDRATPLSWTTYYMEKSL